MNDLVDLAIEIRDELISKKWVNGLPETEDEVCLAIARNDVVYRRAGMRFDRKSVSGLPGSEGFEIRKLMKEEAKARGYFDSVQFNDAPGRIFDEIMDFMDGVIRRAKEVA